jgi:hypothetical protein
MDKVIYQVAMWASVVLACIAGLATVITLAEIAEYGLLMLVPAGLLSIITVGSGFGIVYFGRRFTGHEKVFSNPIEQEVLTSKQRRELRQKRGELVMRRSLIEIENEKDNIVHRQLEAAGDPTKPPHRTRFGDEREQEEFSIYIEDDKISNRLRKQY